MSALTPILLNLEFWFLWAVRLLLRVTAIGIGIVSATLTLLLFLSAGVLGLVLDVLRERSSATGPRLNTKKLPISTYGDKEILP